MSQKPSPPPLTEPQKNVSLWQRFKDFFHVSSSSKNKEGQTITEAASSEEAMMVKNIFLLRQTHIQDIMIPRSHIEALDINASLADALAFFAASGYSRVPVYAETLDDPRGMIHMRDVLNYITRTSQVDAQKKHLHLLPIPLATPLKDLDIIRTVLFVPGSMLASHLLQRMQATHTQMALIIDEYGGTDGLASMEDIVELIVGDIEDEHDDEDSMILREPDETWLIDARAELEDLGETIGDDFSWIEDAQDVDTIGGLIVSLLDRIPKRSEIIDVIPGYRLRILDSDKRRVKRIRLKKLTSSEDTASDTQKES